MSSQELADYLQIKESYLRSHWRDIVKSNAKVGVELYKRGRGPQAEYGVKGWGIEEVCWDFDYL
jgi:hypothetical protein